MSSQTVPSFCLLLQWESVRCPPWWFLFCEEVRWLFVPLLFRFTSGRTRWLSVQRNRTPTALYFLSKIISTDSYEKFAVNGYLLHVFWLNIYHNDQNFVNDEKKTLKCGNYFKYLKIIIIIEISQKTQKMKNMNTIYSELFLFLQIRYDSRNIWYEFNFEFK